MSQRIHACDRRLALLAGPRPPQAAGPPCWLTVAFTADGSFAWYGPYIDAAAAERQADALRARWPEQPWRCLRFPTRGWPETDDPATQAMAALVCTVLAASLDPHEHVPSAVRHAAYRAVEDTIRLLASADG